MSFFNYKKGFKKGYIEMVGFFYCEISYEVRQTYRFYTTNEDNKRNKFRENLSQKNPSVNLTAGDPNDL